MTGHPSKGARGDVIYQMIGVGFGPANLALAIAIQEDAAPDGGPEFRHLFLESKLASAWHPGMLLEDSLIQISVLKDLVTVRNPRSHFTFLNYLKIKGRLFEFLNLRDLFPTRIEFNDYLSWAAAELRESVSYGKQVIAVSPVAGRDRHTIDLLKITTRDVGTGDIESYQTENLVLATGGVPWVPDGITLRSGGRAFHAHEFLQRMSRDYPSRDGRYRFIVVGSGQSGAELFYYLVTRYPNADVTAAIRRFAYKPVDDSDFTNEIFFPQKVDLLYGLPGDKRELILEACRDVNYAVVDLPLIKKIYRELYQEKVLGRDRARILPFMELKSTSETGSGVAAEFHDILHDRTVNLQADALILATGYTWQRQHPLLEELAPYLIRDASNRYKVERGYNLSTSPSLTPRIFLQGFAEDTHGASETVLSLLPMRAGDILKSLLDARRA